MYFSCALIQYFLEWDIWNSQKMKGTIPRVAARGENPSAAPLSRRFAASSPAKQRGRGRGAFLLATPPTTWAGDAGEPPPWSEVGRVRWGGRSAPQGGSATRAGFGAAMVVKRWRRSAGVARIRQLADGAASAMQRRLRRGGGGGGNRPACPAGGRRHWRAASGSAALRSAEPIMSEPRDRAQSRDASSAGNCLGDDEAWGQSAGGLCRASTIASGVGASRMAM